MNEYLIFLVVPRAIDKNSPRRARSSGFNGSLGFIFGAELEPDSARSNLWSRQLPR